MPNKHVKSLLLGVLLIPLVWIGIVLVSKLHGSHWLIPAMAIWGIVFVADLAGVVYLSTRSRGERVDRTSRHRPAA